MKRALDIGVFVLLCLAAAWTAIVVYGFSQARFFTIDEYQYGHATWLVSQGQLPYRDFFEHHFPLSYVLHAPFFWVEHPFDEGALLLRRIVFASWLALCLLTTWTAKRVTGDRLAAVLLGFVPMTFGFSLMSAIDYRADNFGAIYFAAFLVLLEWNRSARRLGVAIACGLLLTAAAAMTQKMAFVGGCTLALLLTGDWVARRFGGPERLPFVARPGALLASAVALGVLLLAVAAALGILPAAFESTIVQAAEHERYYQGFSVFGKGYVGPFWRETWSATLPILLFASGYLVTREGRFWLAPVAAAGLAVSLLKAPYPYNFVLLCWLVVVAAVRGFARAVAFLRERAPAFESTAALLYLLPLPAVIVQLGFLSETSSNAHQLVILRKIEAYGTREDAVIDSAGGAMFSPHASYYYLHGAAHRKMFRDYFENGLVDDWRRSQALFWILDARFKKLPKNARDYLYSHYVHGGDGLFVLGTRTPETDDDEHAVEPFSVIRAGEYQVHPAPGAPPGSRADHDLEIDGRVPVGGRIHLEPGEHRILVHSGSPAYLVTLVDASFFDEKPGPPRYTMMFEHRERTRPTRRTVIDLADLFADAAERKGARLVKGGIVQEPGSRLRYRVALPEEPRLAGHVKLEGDAPPQGRFVVEVRDAGRHDVLVSEPLGPLLRHPGFTMDASLAPYAEREVEISAHFDAEPGDRRLSWTKLLVQEVIAASEDEELD